MSGYVWRGDQEQPARLNYADMTHTQLVHIIRTLRSTLVQTENRLADRLRRDEAQGYDVQRDANAILRRLPPDPNAAAHRRALWEEASTHYQHHT